MEKSKEQSAHIKMLHAKAKKEDWHGQMLKAWTDMQPWKSVRDIPSPPRADKKDWDEVFIPTIIRCGGIPMKDLIDGATYRGSTRNAEIAMWDAKNKDFIHYRSKFNSRFRDKVNHFEDDNGFALFIPLKLLRR